MTDSVIFLIGLTLIFLHEMDAVRCKEWRIFPWLSNLSDKAGQTVYLIAHIPIFFWFFWCLTIYEDFTIFRRGFDVFLFVHLILHLLFLNHKNNEFKDWISWTIIAGAGICGVLDLILITR